MAETIKSFEEDQKRLKENLAAIKKINTLLKIAAIMGIIALASVLFVETDLFAYVLIIGLLGAGIASYCCADATGHGMVDISELGGGCGTFLYMPIYSAMYTYYIFSGWVYGLIKRAELVRENEQIIAKHGDKIYQSVQETKE